MKLTYFHEPALEFGAGRHVDVRFGIANYGTFDRSSWTANPQIPVGIVGTNQTIEAVLTWLDKCRTGILAKETRKPNLFPAFPGFGEDSCFGVSFICEPRCQRSISQNSIDELAKIKDHGRLVEEAAQLFVAEVEYLANETNAGVLICAPPLNLLDLVDAADNVDLPEDADSDTEEESLDAAPEIKRGRLVFHHQLKARVMGLKKPIQLVRPHTYGGRAKKTRRGDSRSLQDEATRAWNFHTAMYYKAGGVPWRMVRDSSDFTTCYVGINFYKALDEESLMTSLAQVFNQRGDGVVVRGGQARYSKDDRTIHLPADTAKQIMTDALHCYRGEHKTYPARVVVHKSSEYSQDEREAIMAAVHDERIELCDLVSLRRSHTRLFRTGYYPPLRGTCLNLDQNSSLLYTRGSVPFFEEYPGMYIPRPLDVRYEHIEQSCPFLAQEILALTKMNWNNTQFDGAEPITLRAARQVGSVMKYVPLNSPVHPRYSYYM